MKNIILKTERLILRQPKLSDWKDVVEGIGNYAVSKMLLRVPFPYTEKDAKNFISESVKKIRQKTPTDIVFFLELKSDKKVIGAVGIHGIDYSSGVGTTGSWINKKYWRNGFATEAKIAVNDFVFNKLGLRRLNSDIYTDNKASNATQIKMGYILEGQKRRAVKSKASGKIHDENIYGLLKEDWQKARKKLLK